MSSTIDFFSKVDWRSPFTGSCCTSRHIKVVSTKSTSAPGVIVEFQTVGRNPRAKIVGRTVDTRAHIDGRLPCILFAVASGHPKILQTVPPRTRGIDVKLQSISRNALWFLMTRSVQRRPRIEWHTPIVFRSSTVHYPYIGGVVRAGWTTRTEIEFQAIGGWEADEVCVLTIDRWPKIDWFAEDEIRLGVSTCQGHSKNPQPHRRHSVTAMSLHCAALSKKWLITLHP